MFVAIAFHHPHPDHVEDLMGHMLKTVALVREHAPDGLIEFSAFREEGGERLIGLSRWHSREAFEAAVPLIASRAGERGEAWSIADDQLLTLAPAER
jgi:quinol monooxygenase YgiN